VRLLMDQYAHFVADPDALGRQLDCLLQLHGRATIDRWKEMAHAADWEALVAELLERHYDPAYTRAIVSHYPRLPQARTVLIATAAEQSFEVAARELLEDSLEPVA
jgi:tRNA 2-selenouridine synthase